MEGSSFVQVKSSFVGRREGCSTEMERFSAYFAISPWLVYIASLRRLPSRLMTCSFGRFRQKSRWDEHKTVVKHHRIS
ncbi:unnamed protein product [Protopolystoma xenopodis]|uniref:Uncharacterized protein n=1 Tax=Protopolystoma xenopodis TaxID=117903 RepID=A0A448XAR8_9PLAT|nr:unnamed protein product [Protopolystoma xenopodis]